MPADPNAQSSFRRSDAAAWGLAALLIVAAAWIPSVRNYTPVADDFSLAAAMDHGFGPYLKTYVHGPHGEGIWRVFQQPVVYFLTRPFPLLFPIVAVTVNVATAGLFYGVCRRLARSKPAAAVATVLTFAFPWGFQALLWASGFGNVIATFGFFLCFYVILTCRRRRRILAAVFLFVATLLTDLTQENQLLCFAALGLFAIIPRRPMRVVRASAVALRRLRVRYEAFAPAAATAVYVAAYKLTQTGSMSKKQAVHLAGFVSVYARQYTNAMVFEVWLKRNLVAEGFRAGGLLVGIAAGVALAGCAVAFTREKPRVVRRAVPARLAALVVILLAASAVFALANGGWSNDSRKKYGTAPLVVLFAATAVACPARKISWKRPLLALAIIAVPTTWLVSGIYDTEVVRAKLLAEMMAMRPPEKRVAVRWVPDVYASWPHFEMLLGMRFDDQGRLDEATEAAGRPTDFDVVLPGQTPPPGTTLLTVNAADVVASKTTGQ